jgi:hypothetical protein
MAKQLQLTNNVFEMPQDASLRPPAEKRALTICNLFANKKLTVAQIMNLLEESYGNVIEALISHKLVHERRRKVPRLIKGDRRRSSLTI